jgi:hypothetical protein
MPVLEPSDSDSIRVTNFATGPSAAYGGLSSPNDSSVTASLHTKLDSDGLLVKVDTPHTPIGVVDHVPCDIVIIVNVSGSMGGVGQTSPPIPTISSFQTPVVICWDCLGRVRHHGCKP